MRNEFQGGKQDNRGEQQGHGDESRVARQIKQADAKAAQMQKFDERLIQRESPQRDGAIDRIVRHTRQHLQGQEDRREQVAQEHVAIMRIKIAEEDIREPGCGKHQGPQEQARSHVAPQAEGECGHSAGSTGNRLKRARRYMPSAAR